MVNTTNNLIISVSEARKLLGEKSIKMTDKEVRELILVLDEFAKTAFEALVSNSSEVNCINEIEGSKLN